MPRRRPARHGEPAHVVLDNEALRQVAAGRPSRPLLVALEAAAATTGRIVLPTSVIVERLHDPTAPALAEPTVSCAPHGMTSSLVRVLSRPFGFESGQVRGRR